MGRRTATMQTPSIGQALRQLRVERGQTLSELEQRTGIGRGYLSYVELGKRPTPSLTVVAKVAQALELDQEAQFLLALALQDRIEPDCAEYRRLRPTLPAVRYTDRDPNEGVRLSTTALERFIGGQRDPQNEAAMQRTRDVGMPGAAIYGALGEMLLTYIVEQA